MLVVAGHLLTETGYLADADPAGVSFPETDGSQYDRSVQLARQALDPPESAAGSMDHRRDRQAGSASMDVPHPREVFAEMRRRCLRSRHSAGSGLERDQV